MFQQIYDKKRASLAPSSIGPLSSTTSTPRIRSRKRSGAALDADKPGLSAYTPAHTHRRHPGTGATGGHGLTLTTKKMKVMKIKKEPQCALTQQQSSSGLIKYISERSRSTAEQRSSKSPLCLLAAPLCPVSVFNVWLGLKICKNRETEATKQEELFFNLIQPRPQHTTDPCASEQEEGGTKTTSPSRRCPLVHHRSLDVGVRRRKS